MQIVRRNRKDDTSDLPTIEANSCDLPWNLQAFGNGFIAMNLSGSGANFKTRLAWSDFKGKEPKNIIPPRRRTEYRAESGGSSWEYISVTSHRAKDESSAIRHSSFFSRYNEESLWKPWKLRSPLLQNISFSTPPLTQGMNTSSRSRKMGQDID